MFLQIYTDRLSPGLCARANVRSISRAITQLRGCPGLTFVTTRERDLTPSQVAVLTAIADEQELDFLAALEAGTLP
jgi:hypothetical protein